MVAGRGGGAPDAPVAHRPLCERGDEVQRRAAEAGEATAQHKLAICYEKGSGVAIDLAEAFEWFKRAAEAGVTVPRTKLLGNLRSLH